MSSTPLVRIVKYLITQYKRLKKEEETKASKISINQKIASEIIRNVKKLKTKENY